MGWLYASIFQIFGSCLPQDKRSYDIKTNKRYVEKSFFFEGGISLIYTPRRKRVVKRSRLLWDPLIYLWKQKVMNETESITDSSPSLLLMSQIFFAVVYVKWRNWNTLSASKTLSLNWMSKNLYKWSSGMCIFNITLVKKFSTFYFLFTIFM